MSTLGEIATAIKEIDVYSIMQEVLKVEKIQDFVKDSIYDRIHNSGITGNGVRLRTDKANSGHVYSPFTERIKKYKGQPINNVTLDDTGRAWNTFKMIVKNKSFKTELNLQKGNESIADNFTRQFNTEKAFHDAVTNLNENEMQMLIEEYIEPRFLEIFNENL